MRLKNWFYTVPLRLRSLFRRRQVEQELDEELSYHIERQIEENIAKGMTPGEARYAALRAMGGVERRKEECRDTRRVRLIEDLVQDLRYGLRTLRKNPGFTAVAALSLALGIGANTAIFSLVDAILLKTLPVKDPEQLVAIEAFNQRGERPRIFSYPLFERLRDRSQVFTGVLAAEDDSNCVEMAGPESGGQTEQAEVQLVSGEYFQVLGVNAVAGRLFTSADNQKPGAHPVAALSYGFWRRRFAGDVSVIGKSITLKGQQFTIIGVTPPEFFGETVGRAPDIWAPMMMQPQFARGQSYLDKPNVSWLRVMARLRPGANGELVQAELATLLGQIKSEPGDMGKLAGSLYEKIITVPCSRGLSELRDRFSNPLHILMAVVGLALLIACANVANLLLARAATRRKVLAVRAALGAGRRRLVRQLLTESAILSLLGGAIGLLLAHWGARALLAISPEQMPRINEIRINGWVVGFTLSLSLLTGVVFGLIPALSSSRIDLTGSLKDGASITTTGFRPLRHHRARSLLVVSEITLALVLLAGAGLLIKSFLRLLDVEKGFAPENVLTLLVELPETKYPEAHQTNAFWQRLIEGIEKLPGVQTVAMTSSLPLTKRGALTSIQIAGRAPESLPVADDSQAGGLPPAPGGGFGASAVYSAISPDYFRAMGIALLRGRQFTEQDIEKKPMVVIISEAMARRYWPGEDAVGQQINPGFSDSSWFTVVGVVSNVRHFRLEAEARPEMYFPYLQISDENAAHSMSVVIRATVAPATLANAVRKHVWDLDADQPITELATMEEKLATVMTTRRFNLLTLGAFAALAMALVALGIYGVMAYHATQRTHEIGVRMALGARPREVLTLALGQGMKLTLAGVALGLVSAFALTRSMKSLLFDISATDPLTFVSVTLLLVIVAFIASYIPARRAMKVDPLRALRHD